MSGCRERFGQRIIHVFTRLSYDYWLLEIAQAPYGFMNPGFSCLLLKRVCISAGPAMMLSARGISTWDAGHELEQLTADCADVAR